MNLRSAIVLIGALFLLTTLTNCKKSDPTKDLPDLNGLYKASAVINLSGTEMYTKNGKITDHDSIQAYINRHSFLVKNNANFFFLNATTIPNGTGKLIEVKFSAGDKATWIEPLTDTVIYTETNVTQKSATGFLLKSTTTRSYIEGPSDYTLIRPYLILENSSSVNMLTNCSTEFYLPSYQQQCTIRQAYPFAIKNGQLYLLSYSFSLTTFRSKTDNDGEASVPISGILDPAILKQLITGDTLLYQARTILFSKQ